MVNSREGVSPAAPVAMPTIMPRSARKGMTWTILLSCRCYKSSDGLARILERPICMKLLGEFDKNVFERVIVSLPEDWG